MSYKCPVPNCNDHEAYSRLNFLWNHFRDKHLEKSEVPTWMNLIRSTDELDNRCKDYLIKKTKEHLFNLQEDDVSNATTDYLQTETSDCINLVDYLCTDRPVCREERQYALLLANCLKMNHSNTVKRLLFGESRVLEVFYEATILRDYWFRSKGLVNNKLWNYISKKTGDVQTDLYQSTSRHPNYWLENMKHPYAMWMMNTKPDIAVLWENSQETYLSFIECKYLSDLDEYTYLTAEKAIVKSQLEIQEYILDFLCNELKIKYTVDDVEDYVRCGDVKLARFISTNIKKDEKEIEIKISDLLDC